MSDFANQNSSRTEYAYKKYGSGTEIIGEDKKLVQEWNDGHNTLCEICGEGGHVLLCDYCNLCFHMECLTPPLKVVPDVLFLFYNIICRETGHVLCVLLNLRKNVMYFVLY